MAILDFTQVSKLFEYLTYASIQISKLIETSYTSWARINN